MKRTILFILCVQACLHPIFAIDFERDGIFYNIITMEDGSRAAEVNSDRRNSIGDVYVGDIVIPQAVTYEGESLPVTRIGSRAFAYNNITSVSLPSSIIRIDSRAFEECHELRSIVLPENLESVGEYAFIACKNLREVKLNKSLKRIEARAFAGTMINAITIPSSVTYVGASAFATPTLESVTVLTEECGDWFSGNGFIRNVILGPSVKRIASKAFRWQCNLISISIPESVTEIGYCAFEHCTEIASITLPKNLKALGWHCFNECENLKDIISYVQEPFELEREALYGVNNEAILRVPIGTKPAYIEAGWNQGVSDIREFDPATAIISPSDKSVNRKSVNRNFLDLSGRCLPSLPTRKGIYIKDGRKVLIK